MKRQIVNSNVFFVILAACMLLVVQSVTYGEATVSISPSSVVSPAVGQQLTLSINITGGMNVYSYAVYVTFDPIALSYVSIAEGGYIADVAFGGEIRLSDNRVDFVAASTSGTETDGGGTLATVTFRVVAVKDSTIGLSVVLGNRRLQPLDVTARGGRVTATATGTGRTPTTNTGPSSSGTTSPPPSPNLVKISDDNQVTTPDDSVILTIKLRDSDGSPMSDVDLIFFILSGDRSRASLSPTRATTDASGHAQTTLTFGTDAAGEYIVDVHRSDNPDVYTEFTVTVDPLLPKAMRLEKISGDNQTGLTGGVWAAPFVVEVRDQYDAPLAGTTVTFTVLTGGGRLSAETTTTDANGWAASTLRLGTEPGTNTVEVSVEGISEPVTFTAEAMPPTLTSVSGNNQSAAAGTALANPFVVEVRDGNGKPLAGVAITFVVLTGGGTLSNPTSITDANG